MNNNTLLINDNNDIYVGFTKETVISILMEFWALENPQEYFHKDAAYFTPQTKNDPLRKELATAIADLPEFQAFLQKLLLKCVSEEDHTGLDTDDIYRFAKIAIKNIPDYESRRTKVRDFVNKCIKEAKSKTTQKEIRHSKKILKLAGFKFFK